MYLEGMCRLSYGPTIRYSDCLETPGWGHAFQLMTGATIVPPPGICSFPITVMILQIWRGGCPALMLEPWPSVTSIDTLYLLAAGRTE